MIRGFECVLNVCSTNGDNNNAEEKDYDDDDDNFDEREKKTHLKRPVWILMSQSKNRMNVLCMCVLLIFSWACVRTCVLVCAYSSESKRTECVTQCQTHTNKHSLMFGFVVCKIDFDATITNTCSESKPHIFMQCYTNEPENLWFSLPEQSSSKYHLLCHESLNCWLG